MLTCVGSLGSVGACWTVSSLLSLVLCSLIGWFLLLFADDRQSRFNRGIYDEEYIEYLIKLLKIAAKYGLKCFLDPHVDCWSRFSGGSGM